MPSLPRSSILLLAAVCAHAQDEPAVAHVDTFLATHCLTCHGGDTTKGGLDLSVPAPDRLRELWRWSRIRDRLRAGEMPPPSEEAPPAAERDAYTAAIDARLRRDVPGLPPDPGRVTVRRLSRVQWENSVRDLFGVSVPTAAFPAADLGYGFDTVGDALTFSTLHLETHLAAAREVAWAVFDGEDPARPTVRRFEAEAMRLVDGPGAGLDGEIANLYTRATLEQTVRLPREGSYRLRIHAGADQAGDEPARMVLRIDDREVARDDVPRREPQSFDHETTLARGEHRIALAFVNDYYDRTHPDPTRRDRNLRIDWFELTGPTDERAVPEAQRWLRAAIAGPDDRARLRAFTRALLPRAWRRVVSDDEVSRFVALGDGVLRAEGALIPALRVVLQAVLASPHFLFRLEPGANEGKAGDVVPLPSAALAVRLSYFLWASTPDARLLELAQKGRLAEPAVLAAEVQRLLDDERADSLATDFAVQWLELRSLADRTPDPARFPGFDDELRQSLRRETELLFAAVLREDRDVRELLDCDFTHVDARLAALYGLPVPKEAGAGFVRVTLPASHRERGGVLGHGSVLAVTSNPTRTSPVKRGKWILENLLGQAPPPPPPGNDTLANEDAIDSSKTFREQLAQHRERSSCAGCHVRMDTLGFALERYDAIGRFRAEDAAGPIDCSGELPGGVRIDGLADLKRVLVRDDNFVHVMARKLFVYALGRDLRPADRLRLDHRVQELLAMGPVTLRDLVLLVVQDDAFRLRTVERG